MTRRNGHIHTAKLVVLASVVVFAAGAALLVWDPSKWFEKKPEQSRPAAGLLRRRPAGPRRGDRPRLRARVRRPGPVAPRRLRHPARQPGDHPPGRPLPPRGHELPRPRRRQEASSTSASTSATCTRSSPSGRATRSRSTRCRTCCATTYAWPRPTRRPRLSARRRRRPWKRRGAGTSWRRERVVFKDTVNDVANDLKLGSAGDRHRLGHHRAPVPRAGGRRDPRADERAQQHRPGRAAQHEAGAGRPALRPLPHREADRGLATFKKHGYNVGTATSGRTSPS